MESRILRLLRKFKKTCNSYGWAISEKDDWVRTGGEYHNFIWARTIHPSSFESINSKRKCVIREGLTYDVVEASYVAWLFSERPPQKLVETVCTNPEFSERIAVYTLPVLNGRKAAFKLNITDSPVFKAFEDFLVERLNVNLKPFSVAEIVSEKRAVTNLA